MSKHRQWKPQPDHVYLDWIETIKEEASGKLDAWETGFINNMNQRLTTGGKELTPYQAEKLEQIYVEKCP